MSTPERTTVAGSTSTARKIVKPGYKTTEFWLAVATEVGLLAGALAHSLPPRYAAIASAVSFAGYGIARGLAKR